MNGKTVVRIPGRLVVDESSVFPDAGNFVMLRKVVFEKVELRRWVPTKPRKAKIVRESVGAFMFACTTNI